MIRRNWTKDELILTFALYLRLPFGKMHHNNPDVIYIAQLINRTPGAVAMRLGNFASLDPYHQHYICQAIEQYLVYQNVTVILVMIGLSTLKIR